MAKQDGALLQEALQELRDIVQVMQTNLLKAFTESVNPLVYWWDNLFAISNKRKIYLWVRSRKHRRKKYKLNSGE